MNDLLNYIAFVLISGWNIACCVAAIMIVEFINERSRKRSDAKHQD